MSKSTPRMVASSAAFYASTPAHTPGWGSNPNGGETPFRVSAYTTRMRLVTRGDLDGLTTHPRRGMSGISPGRGRGRPTR